MITIKIQGITVEINDEVSSSKLSPVEVAELAINKAMSEVAKLSKRQNPAIQATLESLDLSKLHLKGIDNSTVERP